MECPECRQNNEKSMSFPANNLEFSPKIQAFHDDSGIYIDLKQVALQYGCTRGHLFRLEQTKTVNAKALQPV